jgi:hypothetical protein
MFGGGLTSLPQSLMLLISDDWRVQLGGGLADEIQSGPKDRGLWSRQMAQGPGLVPHKTFPTFH